MHFIKYMIVNDLYYIIKQTRELKVKNVKISVDWALFFFRFYLLVFVVFCSNCVNHHAAQRLLIFIFVFYEHSDLVNSPNSNDIHLKKRIETDSVNFPTCIDMQNYFFSSLSRIYTGDF